MSGELADVIREARRRAGLSQAALARRAGVSASYMSRIEGAAWERGGPWPTDAVLRALARALGLSSTELVRLRRAAEDRRPAPAGGGTHAGGTSRRSPYAVSVGPAEVDAAARGVVGRNPPAGTLRSVQVVAGPAEDAPSYLDVVAEALAGDPQSMLYRVCAADSRALPVARATVDRLAGGRSTGPAANVRTRVAFCNPLVLDVLIGDHEVFLGVPDRRGHPHLRAGVVVDDPDFVAAVRAWFDESVWDPTCGYADVRGDVDEAFRAIGECLSGAEQNLDPAAAGAVGPGPDADVLEGAGEDVVPVRR